MIERDKKFTCVYRAAQIRAYQNIQCNNVTL